MLTSYASRRQALLQPHRQELLLARLPEELLPQHHKERLLLMRLPKELTALLPQELLPKQQR